ncbi:uncharacterized protein SPSC_01843 [Sporisorium scitamineum]|uniref:Uncharacterized protein n=1 Tax=Sporisorium scitamineum TaxID=49012 RepID=A0A0F7RZZ0_9BASI|nr:hypothetical protein [Sporisorium scitamineum]CDU23214.1 uncharacterized protein SPSC_01843 [Sporisorium scitamineum]
MNARDVDLEFEKAYQRLFSTSAAPTADGRSSSASSEPQAKSSKAPHIVDNNLRSTSTSASAARLDRSKQLHGLSALQPFSEKVRSQERSAPVQQLHRERHLQTRSLKSPLDALVRHASNSKGKARGSSQLEPEERPVKRGHRSSTATPAPVVPHSSSVPYPGSLAYYPYPTGQPSYQVSGPLIASGSNMASMPTQAVAWTQPIMSAGPMPAIGYPGFSASVTFSQPQFFASPPQPVPSAVAAPPSDAWSQQYAAPPTSYDQQQQFNSTASSSRHQPRAFSSVGRLVEHDNALQQWNKEQAAKFDSKEHLRRTFKSAPLVDVQKVKVKQDRRQNKAKQQQQQSPWRPDIDENDLRVPKKKGRTARVRDATPQDVKPPINATEPTIRIKAEGGTEAQPLNPAKPRPAFDGSLPLASDRGPPFNKETHTLFIHSQRRLRWLARLAILRAEQRADGGSRVVPSVADTSQWARWSNSVAARLQNVRIEAVSNNDETSASQQTQSQSDPAGLFPRDKRQAYVVLRKGQHSAKRTASTRVCMRKLLRYLAKTVAAAERLDSRKERLAVLKDKHRTVKLAKHMLKFARPTALDLRRMWSVWARAAHANSLNKTGGAAAGRVETRQRWVSFALPSALDSSNQADIGVTEDEGGTKVKLEPASPSTRIMHTPPPNIAQVKQEPDSDGIMTPLLPGTPTPGGAGSPFKAEVEAAPNAAAVHKQSPLFLRRNFRVYRLLGLDGLPLS